MNFRHFYADYMHFYTFVYAILSEAESTFVLIHTLFACPAIPVSAFQGSPCGLPWPIPCSTIHLHDHHNLQFDYRQTFQR